MFVLILSIECPPDKIEDKVSDLHALAELGRAYFL